MALTILLSSLPHPNQALGGAPSSLLCPTASSPSLHQYSFQAPQPPGLFPLWSQSSFQSPVQLFIVIIGGGSGQCADP